MSHLRANRFGWIYHSNFVEIDIKEISSKKLIYANVSKHVEKKLEKSNNLAMINNFTKGINLIHSTYVSSMIQSCYKDLLNGGEQITSSNSYLEQNMISDRKKLDSSDLIALSTWNKDFSLTKDSIENKMKLFFTMIECLNNINNKSGRVGIIVPRFKKNCTYYNRVNEELFNLIGYLVKFSGKNTCCLHFGNEFYCDIEDVLDKRAEDDFTEIISISDCGETSSLGKQKSRLTLWNEFDAESQIFRRLESIDFTKFKRIMIVLNFKEGESWIKEHFGFFKKLKDNLKLFEVVFIAVDKYNATFLEESMLGYWDGTILGKNDLNI